MTSAIPERIAQSSHCHVVIDDHDNAYASRDIQPGELIEMAPSIIVPRTGRKSAFNTVAPLSNAAYVWNHNADEIGMAMGCLALYGYSVNPNAVVEPDHSMRVFRAKATRLIRAGEHLTRIQQFNGRPDETESLPPLGVGSVLTHPVVIRKSQWGLGVFAAEDIEADQVVEVCPTIQIGPEDRRRAGRLDLERYVYSWKNTGKDETVALSLGYGGIYNHSSDNNVYYLFDMEQNRIIFHANRDIPKGSEILNNYGWSDDDKRFS